MNPVAEILKKCSPGSRLLAAALVGLLAGLLLVSCGRREEKAVEVPFREVEIDSGAVKGLQVLVAPSHQPQTEELSAPLRILFTYLSRTSPGDLVVTPEHGQGRWRVEKIFLLDDCVAVQMSEGHYLETLFFVQQSRSWRLAARITPEDHQ